MSTWPPGISALRKRAADGARRKEFEMRFGWIVAAGVLVLAAQGVAQESVLKDKKEKVSYIIGREIGTNLRSQNIEVDPDALAKGTRDALTGAASLLKEEETRAIMEEFQKEVMAKRQALAKELGEKNKKEGEAFFADNKTKDGVQALPSGLQYKVIKKGTGKKPKATDTVTTHYRGTLIDGTEFDSSYGRGQPATFPVNGVIPGWTEALQLMEEGSKWQIFVPSNLAYGDRGAGPKIGPNATLVFEIELISVEEKK